MVSNYRSCNEMDTGKGILVRSDSELHRDDFVTGAHPRGGSDPVAEGDGICHLRIIHLVGGPFNFDDGFVGHDAVVGVLEVQAQVAVSAVREEDVADGSVDDVFHAKGVALFVRFPEGGEGVVAGVVDDGCHDGLKLMELDVVLG